MRNKYGGIFMEKESELRGIEIKNITNNGYLVCSKCKGYYKLKDNEYFEDFEACECGNTLDYHQNIEIPNISDSSNYNRNFQNDFKKYQKEKKIVNKIKQDNIKRANIIEKLHNNVKEQEKLLNAIKTDKILQINDNEMALWNLIESHETENNPVNEKMMIDNMREQENLLISKVHDKRKSESSNSPLKSYYGKMAVITLTIVILAIIGIYLIR